MSDSWFDQMDKAMQARKVAIAGRDRWQEKVDAAEAAIAELTALRDAPAPAPAVLTDMEAAVFSSASDEEVRQRFASDTSTSVNATAPANVYVQ